MTQKQLTNKIEALNFWLTANPEHPDYQMMLQQKRDFQLKLQD